jgi:hypothetical protein
MTLLKGTKYHRSELGHNNFLYPEVEEHILSEDVRVESLPYVSGSIRRSKAYKVLNGELKSQVVWIYETKED